MLVPGILGFQTLLPLLLFLVVFLVWIDHKWRNALARKEEIQQLVEMVSHEYKMAEYEASYELNAVPRPYQCAVCFCPTTTRCSQCKSVRYCSGKCQIIHWRQGHKDECRPLTVAVPLKQGSEFCRRAVSEKQSEIQGAVSLVEVSPNEELGSSGTGKFERIAEDIASDTHETRTSSEEIQETKLPPSKSVKLVNCVDGDSRTTKLNKMTPSHTDEGVNCKSQLLNGKTVVSDDIRSENFGYKKSMRRAASSEVLVTDASKVRSSPSSSSSRLDSVTNVGEDDSQLLNGKEVRSLSFNSSGSHSQDACNGLKKSVWTKVQQFRSSKKSNNYKIIFPYELFVKLYSCNEELYPFGLRNCGNSCYANAVLLCLAFTRPLTSYLVRRLHSNSCRKKEWCFICEFEFLILKAREGESALSPIGILSKMQKFGSHLGHGREEDAHEFLRYAVDVMQSVCLKEAGALGPLAEETTLVGLTFGGYLRSKTKCMRCHGKSEKFEQMMDLTVEIDGDIDTLDEALTQFTAEEILDGENKYYCSSLIVDPQYWFELLAKQIEFSIAPSLSRCKSYVRAKKKLTVLVAPNILTIVLKRFQSGNFGKLNKSVRFPDALNMAPYMHGRSDRSAQYNLYAVVVHVDMMNSTSTGHYVCYVKNFRGEWFGINDSSVIPVELERVLSEGAYMLLYARNSPRAPVLLRNDVACHGARPKNGNLEAVPTSLSTSKTRSNSHVPTTDRPKAQTKHDRYPYRTTVDDSADNLHDLDDWRFHHMCSVPLVDSSSESSSIFSSSDASSCSTASTKDSSRSQDLSDFLFGDVKPGCYSHVEHSSDSVAYTWR